MDSNRVFKLTKFVPFGYTIPVRNSTICAVCRNKIFLNCIKCDTNNLLCQVITVNNIDYHTHCYEIMK